MDFLQMLETAFPPQQLALVKIAGQIAQDEGVPLYLVGGAVRDLLLGRPTQDLDLVVEGDAETLAYIIAKRLSGQVVSRSQFSTAKVKVGGQSLDLVTARSEHYSRPGALPQIAHGNIEEDLARRDFTVNAMAFPLHLGVAGRLLDPFGGEVDRRRGLIRVLHPKSFVDDATRIMRAIRYEQRLGFHLEDETETLLCRDLPMLDTISGDRLRRELHLWLEEEHWVETLIRADRLGVMAAIHPSLAGSATVVERVGRSGLEEEVYLGLLAYPMNPSEGEQLIGRLHMPSRWATVVRDTIALKSELPRLSDANLPPARLYEALAPSTVAAVQACALAATNEATRQNLTLFLERLRHVKPSLGGKDLIEMGVPQGPAIGEMLVKLRSARLEGAVTTRAQEVEWVKGWLLTQQQS
ncbi:MAG: CCA tRNA nucleotidyltransferase [Chloroflexi bacterium]|nr:CCA tRNA nucleotidyltransferase [Chloroflexota bacterium]